MMKHFCLGWMVFLCAGLLGVSAQPVKTAWYEEPFDKVGTEFAWDIVNNGKLLATVDKGTYTLYNKSAQEELFQLNKSNNLSAFDLLVTLKFLKHSNKQQTAGFYCMLSSQTMSGLFVEIKSNKTFRVRKIINGVTTNLTGTVKDGWISSDGLKKGEEYNELQLRVKDKKYELFFNQKLAYTFSEPSLSTGEMGLISGADSRIAVDLFNVFIEKTAQDNVDTLGGNNQQLTTDNPSGNNGDPLTEVIIRQRLQINQQKKTIDSLTAANAKLKPVVAQGSVAQQLAALKKENTKLRQDIYAIKLKNDSLIRVNTQLSNFKNSIKKAENGDLIIKLSEAIEAEKQKNLEQIKKNEALETDLRKYKFRIQDLEQELEELRKKTGN